MVGRNQGTVSRAPAAEHGQAEHGFQDSCVISSCANGNDKNTKHDDELMTEPPAEKCLSQMYYFFRFASRAAFAAVSSSRVSEMSLAMFFGLES